MSILLIWNGRHEETRTPDLYRVKVARYRRCIDGKGFINRMSRQNRHNRRYLPQKCRKLFSRLKPSGPWAGRGGTAQFPLCGHYFAVTFLLVTNAVRPSHQRDRLDAANGQARICEGRVLKEFDNFRMGCSQPLFPARQLATGDGEGEEDPDRTRPVGEVLGVCPRLD